MTQYISSIFFFIFFCKIKKFALHLGCGIPLKLALAPPSGEGYVCTTSFIDLSLLVKFNRILIVPIGFWKSNQILIRVPIGL